MNKIKKCSQT